MCGTEWAQPSNYVTSENFGSFILDFCVRFNRRKFANILWLSLVSLSFEIKSNIIITI